MLCARTAQYHLQKRDKDLYQRAVLKMSKSWPNKEHELNTLKQIYTFKNEMNFQFKMLIATVRSLTINIQYRTKSLAIVDDFETAYKPKVWGCSFRTLR